MHLTGDGWRPERRLEMQQEDLRPKRAEVMALRRLGSCRGATLELVHFEPKLFGERTKPPADLLPSSLNLWNVIGRFTRPDRAAQLANSRLHPTDAGDDGIKHKVLDLVKDG
jgi:hypothetical protein